ncbi:hypothetical protein BD560DRAFT_401995 [Blakeslea trispora]|nr:hypothetical protein BD560DRAFT_401995 [Blakeslea trispora]
MLSRGLSCIASKRLGRFATSCRYYTSENALLKDINQKMFVVINQAAAADLGSQITLKRVLQLAQELRQNNVKFNHETYEHILSAYSKAGQPSKIKMLQKQMDSHHIKPTRDFYHKALMLAARSGDSVLQSDILHHMEQTGYPKTTKIYSLLILCMRESLELEHALDTIDLMKREKVPISLSIYATLFDMAITLRHPKIAYQILNEAQQLKQFDTQKNEFSYSELLRLATLCDEIDIVRDMWDKATKPDEGLLLYILNLASKYGDTKLASHVIRVIGEQGYTYRECHFAPLIETFTATGDISNAFQLFEAMRKVGVIPNKETAMPLAHRLGHDKNAIAKAKEALLASHPIDVVALNLVIHALAYNKENEEALMLYEQSKQLQVTPNSETLDAVLDACIHTKDIERGTRLYNEVLSRGIKPTASSLSKMVTLMCTQEENYEGAFVYLEKMKKLDIVPFHGCYYKLVKVLSKMQDPRLEMALDDMKAYGYPVSTHLEAYIERGKAIAAAIAATE